MSADQITAGGAFRVGDVLGRAWRMCVGNILFFLGVSGLICAAIAAAIAATASLVDVADKASWQIGAIVVLAVILLGINLVGQGVLLSSAVQRLRGEQLRVGVGLWRALAGCLAVVGLESLLFGMCLALSLVFL